MGNTLTNCTTPPAAEPYYFHEVIDLQYRVIKSVCELLLVHHYYPYPQPPAR